MDEGVMDIGWLADQFVEVEIRNCHVFKIALPAHDAQVSEQMVTTNESKTFWGAKVVIKPSLGRAIALSYTRLDGKKFKRTVPLP